MRWFCFILLVLVGASPAAADTFRTDANTVQLVYYLTAQPVRQIEERVADVRIAITGIRASEGVHLVVVTTLPSGRRITALADSDGDEVSVFIPGTGVDP